MQRIKCKILTGMVMALVVCAGLFSVSQSYASGEGEYEFVTKWGGQGGGDGQFSYPFGVDIDANGNVYVTDAGSNRI
ncbi:MAG: hypothetical protein AAB110_07520 [Candidatus Desantisbacteria bacterium]